MASAQNAAVLARRDFKLRAGRSLSADRFRHRVGSAIPLGLGREDLAGGAIQRPQPARVAVGIVLCDEI